MVSNHIITKNSDIVTQKKLLQSKDKCTNPKTDHFSIITQNNIKQKNFLKKSININKSVWVNAVSVSEFVHKKGHWRFWPKWSKNNVTITLSDF